MILVCGEALIDLFVDGRSSSGLKTEAVAGGSPFNVAIALSRLGRGTAFCGGISQDSLGRILTQRLASEGVDLSYVVHSDRMTTISVVATDETGHPAYSFYGDGTADRQVTTADVPSRLPDAIEAITFGSYTMAVAPVADAFLALAQREGERLTISVDLNVRPTVTPDMTEWRHRFEALLPYAAIVKASDEDLAMAYGTDANIGDLIQRWQAIGPQLIMVTHGEHGATGYLRGQKPVSVPGRKVHVVNTVGAGDTFHAAALASLAGIGRLTRHQLLRLTVSELQLVLRYAVAASSLTCTRQGADVPTAAEVDSILSEDAPQSHLPGVEVVWRLETLLSAEP